MKYDLRDDTYKQPEDGIVLVVSSESVVENAVSTPSILLPGCCFKQTDFHSSHCFATDQIVSLSSTCSFTEDATTLKTLGVVFVHSGEVVLPLSIAGLNSDFSSDHFEPFDKILFDNTAPTCGTCSTDDLCQNSAIHTYNMLAGHSLATTFFAQIKSIIPSSIIIAVPDTSPPPHPTYYPYSFHASLVAPSFLHTYKGCEQLEDVFYSGVVYMFRGDSKLSISVNGESVAHDSSEPVCAAINLCDPSAPVVHFSVSHSLLQQLLALSVLEAWANAGWVFRFYRLSLSAHGLAYTSSENEFWNGTHLVNSGTPLYTVEIKLITAGHLSSNSTEVDINFIGSLYILLRSNVSSVLQLYHYILFPLLIGIGTIIWQRCYSGDNKNSSK